MYTCPHTAVALAALEKLVKKGLVQKRDRVVVVSTASGLKFTEFKVRYHDKTLPGIASTYANPPQDLPADYDQVLKALDAHAKTLAGAR
jgi:threonine synthase